MTPSTRADLQSAILDAAKAAGIGPTGKLLSDAKVGEVMGLDRSQVCKSRDGERVLSLDELVRLVDAYGEVVVEPLASRGVAVTRPALTVVDGLRASLSVARLAEGIGSALDDGKLTDDEAEALQALAQSASAMVAQIERALSRRCARKAS